MSLSSKTELARALFRTPPSESVTRISGTATADSSDGTVTVQLEDGDVIEVGTIGSVSAGDTVTIHVQRGEAQVIASEGWGDAMQAAVDEAAEVANAVNQHFWSDTNGAHVTEVTQEDWNDSQSPNYHAGHNILMNSLGILLRKALNYLGAWTGSAIAFYDGEGNEDSHITAMFGKDGAQVGADGKPRLLVSSDRLSGVNADNAMFFDIDYNGATSVGYSMANGRNAALVLSNSIIGRRSLSGDIQDYADVSAAETGYTIDTTSYEIAVRLSSLQDVDSLASSQNCLVEIVDAEHLVIYPIVSFEAGTDDQIVSQAVLDTTDSGTITITTETSYDSSDGSVSLGLGITTSSSIPRGGGATFTPKAVFACPTVTTAPAYTLGTRQAGSTSGSYSAALGEFVIAEGDHQTALGKYNEADTTSAFIIGNGTSGNARSNALTVDWSGNVDAAGEVKAGGSTPLVPIGTILDFAAATAPTGYLACDGSAVSRSTYAALFAVIGTTWGSGDGSTTFNIPDFRGRTSIGSGTGTGGNATAHALGSKGGDEALQSHSHNASANGDYKFQAIKNASGVAGSFNLQAHSSGNDRYALASTNSSNLTYYTTTQSAGSGGSGNMQPFATVTKIIRAI